MSVDRVKVNNGNVENHLDSKEVIYKRSIHNAKTLDFNNTKDIKKNDEELVDKTSTCKKFFTPKVVLIIGASCIGVTTIGLVVSIIVNRLKGKELPEIDTKEAIDLVGGKTEENYNLIEESIEGLDEVLKELNTNFDFGEIKYDSPKIPNITGTTTDKLNAAKDDISIFSESYQELANQTKDFSKNVSDAFKQISTPINDLKNNIQTLLTHFNDTIIDLSIPLLLEKRGELDSEDSNRLRLVSSSKMEEYKEKVGELDDLYNAFFKHISNVTKDISDTVKEVPSMVKEINDYSQNSISTFKESVKRITNETIHSELINMKNSFLRIKDDMNKKEKKMEETIKKAQILQDDNEKEFRTYQNKFEKLHKEVKDLSNSLIKSSKKKKYKIKNEEAPTIIADSILDSLNKAYQPIITIQIITIKHIGTIIIIISVDRSTSLDLLFMIDLTGSMGPYIDDAKNNLISIMNNIIEKSPGIDINLGFIGYRDVGEEYTYINIDFTKDHNAVRRQIESVYADGGGDAPEDVAWAFEAALNKSWTSNAKFIVFVADAPGHGPKYDPYYGDYYDYDPYLEEHPEKKDIEELVEELAKIGVSQFCLNVSTYTDMMFNVFKSVYDKYTDLKFEIVDSYLTVSSDKIVDSAVDTYYSYRKKKKFD